MSESQHVEWKESWRDEYLKWIGGFANADGGVLIIGRNDAGVAVGIPDARKLLEDIPNKVRDLLGIMVDVNLRDENGKALLEIVVEPYPYPISYKGQYHYRSGSTKQELKGAALDRFLLKKQGKRWDGVPVPHVAAQDLSDKAFDYFKAQATKSKRVSEEDLGESHALLLERLHLNDGSYLKRAAVLLFHPDPERFVTGAYVKIGFFASDDDLRYQDEVHGNLFEQVEGALALLLTKYMKAEIRYEGVSRIEEFPFPEAALREALLNAIAHKDYSSGVPIQISVYEDHILFWNEGQLPENWTVARLTEKHPSRPYNPDIANAFFRAGLIESWGRGTLKILSECRRAGLPAPRYQYDLSGFVVEITGKSSPKSSPKSSSKSVGLPGTLEIARARPITPDYARLRLTTPDPEQLEPEEAHILICLLDQGKISRREVMELLSLGETKVKALFHGLMDKNLLERRGQGRSTYYVLAHPPHGGSNG